MNKPNTLLPEWYPQDAILLCWPHSNSDWQPILTPVETVYCKLVEAIAAQQKIIIIYQNAHHQLHILNCLNSIKLNLKQLIFVQAAANDTWARDFGPLCVHDSHGKLLAYDFIFNAWGDKFSAELDNQINQHIFKQLGTPHQAIDWVLEGGSIEYDGNGTLLTTRACLLNTNRNPSANQQKVETNLKDWFGCQQVLWLDHGALQGDDTDAHIDTLARFIPNNGIVFQGCQEPTDPHFSGLDAMKKQLAQFKNQQQQTYQLFELPWPDAQYNQQQARLPATYANFLIINHAVLLPVYGVSQDRQAIRVMQQAMPGYQIIPIDCRIVIEQFGSLHCLTMQLPKGFLTQEY